MYHPICATCYFLNVAFDSVVEEMDVALTISDDDVVLVFNLDHFCDGCLHFVTIIKVKENTKHSVHSL